MEQSVSFEHPGILFEYSRTIDDFDAGVQVDFRRWELGDATALIGLSRRFTESYEQGIHPENDVQAYAYLDAFLRIADVRWADSENEELVGRQKYGSLLSELAQAKSKLRPLEIEKAHELSDQLIAENSNCCFEF